MRLFKKLEKTPDERALNEIERQITETTEKIDTAFEKIVDDQFNETSKKLDRALKDLGLD